MSQMGGATEHVIGRATIPVDADLAPLEASKRAMERMFDEIADRLKTKLGEAFDGLDQRVASIKTAVEGIRLPEVGQPQQAVAAPPPVVPDQTLGKLTEIAGTLRTIADSAEAIENAPALQGA